MKKLILLIALLISPILAQCDWNEDSIIDILDIVQTVDCVLSDCWSNVIYGCTDSDAQNYNSDANFDDGSCEYSCWDSDNNSYETVVIGDQVWMAENLKATYYSNGDPIPTGFANEEWGDLFDTGLGAFAIYPSDNDDVSQNTCNGNCEEVYGNIYNWYAVYDWRGICPESYHIPSLAEWSTLKEYLTSDGFDENDGDALKESGYTHWLYSTENVNGFDQYNYSGLPGGYRDGNDGHYEGMGENGFFWSSYANSNYSSFYHFLDYEGSGFYWSSIIPSYGFSVRCIRD